jgi:hypothetical protein
VDRDIKGKALQGLGRKFSSLFALDPQSVSNKKCSNPSLIHWAWA